MCVVTVRPNVGTFERWAITPEPSLVHSFRRSLPLAKLEPLPCSRPAGLLPLDRAGIARHQPGRPELGPVLSIGLHQCSRDGVAQRPRLPGLSTTIHVRLHIERAE